MKPCRGNRKPIALLAVGALPGRSADDLRAHLEKCGGCREYYREILRVSESLNATAPDSDLQASERFHRTLLARLASEAPQSVFASVVWMLRGIVWNRRFVALPAIAATAAVIVAAVMLLRPPAVPLPAAPVRPLAAMPQFDSNLPPTMGNYQWVASQSLEKLDELLTAQGNRNLPPAPIYTASSQMPASAAD